MLSSPTLSAGTSAIISPNAGANNSPAYALDRHGVIAAASKMAFGNKLVWMKIEKDQYDLPVYTQLMDQYGKFAADIHSGKIVS